MIKRASIYILCMIILFTLCNCNFPQDGNTQYDELEHTNDSVHDISEETTYISEPIVFSVPEMPQYNSTYNVKTVNGSVATDYHWPITFEYDLIDENDYKNTDVPSNVIFKINGETIVASYRETDRTAYTWNSEPSHFYRSQSNGSRDIEIIVSYSGNIIGYFDRLNYKYTDEPVERIYSEEECLEIANAFLDDCGIDRSKYELSCEFNESLDEYVFEYRNYLWGIQSAELVMVEVRSSGKIVTYFTKALNDFDGIDKTAECPFDQNQVINDIYGKLDEVLYKYLGQKQYSYDNQYIGQICDFVYTCDSMKYVMLKEGVLGLYCSIDIDYIIRGKDGTDSRNLYCGFINVMVTTK